MIPQKLRFLLYVLILISLQNCKKTTTPLHNEKDNIFEIKRLTDLGEKFYTSNQFDSSYYYFNKAKLACDPKKHTKQFVYAISNIATIQQNLGDYSGSENTVMEAMPIIDTTTNVQYKWNIYTILGLNYMSAKDNYNALLYFKKTLKLQTDIERKNKSRNNIALVYVETNKYQEALKIFNEISNYYYVKQNLPEYSSKLNNIGYCYIKMKSKQALHYLMKSLQIKLRIKDEKDIIATYYNLSQYHEDYNPILALKYAKLAYQQAIKLNSSDDRKLCLKLLIELSNDSDIKKYSVQYITLTDSLIRARQIAKNQFAKIKYDSKKEKDENLILKTERAEKDLLFEKQKNNNLLLFALLIIGLLTFLIIFYFIKQKNKKDKIQTSYNTETRISKKLHDELANDLFQTMSFAETQDLSSATNKEILLDNLDTIYSRTRNISMENSPIDTGIYYVTNLKSLIKDFNTNAVNIIVNGFDLIDWSSIPAIQKIVMHRVIQELLVNMKKHSQCTVAVLTFKTESNTIFIRYSDNGIGANLVKSTTHLGIQNMQNRVQSINGKISFDNKTGKGFKVTIELPI